MNSADVLGIVTCLRTTPTKSFHTYRVRGLGPTYERFYEWLKQVNMTRQSDDWPWHYFSLEDPKDAALLKLFWADYMMFEPDEFAPDDPPPRVPTEEENLLSEILAEEINKEILAEIMRHAK